MRSQLVPKKKKKSKNKKNLNLFAYHIANNYNYLRVISNLTNDEINARKKLLC